ncbi:MAG: phosphoenolpyruvate carboxylase [Mucilaginibacter polytrichastri]|nr:phosphoenolpyruvate carboxylase [Mucilaginibacter polytrichastri]
MTPELNPQRREAQFENEVLTRYEVYNSLFLTLPFEQVKDTGILLPFFATHCEEGIKNGQSPREIIESFFSRYEQYSKTDDRMELLFRFIQYIERQVVLFDAVEDAAFLKIGAPDDSLSIGNIWNQAGEEKQKILRKKLEEFTLRIVLTAHPTQFYPGPVLSIITDLTDALMQNDISLVKELLQQLGKTPLLNRFKPTPVDEAVSLAWYLESIFYYAAADLQKRVEATVSENASTAHQVIELGFWPGGDRDGNPNVNAKTTAEVAALLRKALFRAYNRDFWRLRRRITFPGVEDHIAELTNIFYDNSFLDIAEPKNLSDTILEKLHAIRKVLAEKHGSLFIGLVDGLIRKVRLYGCFFASLDIRQDSGKLQNTFDTLKSIAKTAPGDESTFVFDERALNITEKYEGEVADAIETIRLMKDIQRQNGEKAVQRFIISNCGSAQDILQLMQLFLWCGWKQESLTVDFVPLFETVNDLEGAAQTMKKLYEHADYKHHLASRGNRQVIMLGFSDSTKDGGYLMANWSIYKAKVELTAMARQYDIELVFFDGRGGPPARGGGKTHRFYSSMGSDIANDHIQLTIQGQSISTQYGSRSAAGYNMDQLVNAGLVSALQQENGPALDAGQIERIDRLAKTSHRAFLELREHPKFLPYLTEISPLKLLGSINIGSRPMKRNSGDTIKLSDLRAISFVTAWSQLKQNVPGFYGVGFALDKEKKEGRWAELQELYHTSGFFRTLIDNCIMSMSKSDFSITAYLADDPDYGDFWKNLNEEFDRAKTLILELTGTQTLMEKYPSERLSITTRNKIVLPLVLIQHYALQQLHQLRNEKAGQRDVLEKLITRTVYGVVNAGRNLV